MKLNCLATETGNIFSCIKSNSFSLQSHFAGRDYQKQIFIGLIIGHWDTKVHLFIICSQVPHVLLRNKTDTTLVQACCFKNWFTLRIKCWLFRGCTCGQFSWLGQAGTFVYNRRAVCVVFNTTIIHGLRLTKADALVITK